MLETAVQEGENRSTCLPHSVAKQVTRPVCVTRGVDPGTGTTGTILAIHLHITSCGGLNGVPPIHKFMCTQNFRIRIRVFEGNGNPLQHSCLENPMDRGAWWAIVHGVTKSQTRLSDFPFTFFHFKAVLEMLFWGSTCISVMYVSKSGHPGVPDSALPMHVPSQRSGT